MCIPQGSHKGKRDCECIMVRSRLSRGPEKLKLNFFFRIQDEYGVVKL